MSDILKFSVPSSASTRDAGLHSLEKLPTCSKVQRLKKEWSQWHTKKLLVLDFQTIFENVALMHKIVQGRSAGSNALRSAKSRAQIKQNHQPHILMHSGEEVSDKEGPLVFNVPVA